MRRIAALLVSSKHTQKYDPEKWLDKWPEKSPENGLTHKLMRIGMITIF
jgi:hypothetical protein